MPTFHFHAKTPVDEPPPVSLNLPDAAAALDDASRSCRDFLNDRRDHLRPGIYEFTTEDDQARIVSRIRVEVEIPNR